MAKNNIEVFKITGDYIELYKLLKAVGVVEMGSDAKEVIAYGLVLVDGEKETRKACKIRPGQVVEFEGTKVKVI